jgi:hypothetical protein
VACDIVPPMHRPTHRLGALVQRHEPRVWLFWAVGVAVLIATPFALIDPATWIFVLDPELLALVAVVGASLLGANVAGFFLRVTTSLATLGR